MSKIATLLRRTARVEPAPMGFTMATARAKHRSIVVTALVNELSMDAAIAAADAGADCILFEGGDLHDHTNAAQAITSAVKVPCGLRLKKPAWANAKEAREAGLDFLLLVDDSAPASFLLDPEMGFLLTATGDESEMSLRLLESLPIDGLFVDHVNLPLTLKRQLELRRSSGLSRKPLLAGIDVAPLSEDLECLRDSGVAALVIEAGGDLPRRIADLQRDIENLPTRPRRRAPREDGSPVLPSLSHGRDEAESEDE